MVIHQLIEQPPIIQAIIRGDYDELKEIVDKNSDEVNYKDSEKRTALHAAAFKVDISMIELLLNHGAKVNVKDSKWVTPLHWACSSRDQDVVQLLLKHKADPLAKDKQYQSPFHVAAANNSSAEIIELLLVALQENIVQKNNKSSEENIQNDQNSSVCLVKDNSQFNLLDSNVPTESNLVLNNCNNDNFKPKFKYMTLTTPKDNFSPSVLYSLNMADRGGRTLLHHAAFDGSLEIAEYLLSKGCLVNVVDKRDCTPLHWASFSGNEEMVRLLLDYNADPNVQDKDKYTPLHIACMTGNLSVVSELLAHPKTDVNAKNVWGNTPLLVACLHNDCDELVVELLASGAEINMQNHRGDSSLHITAQHGRFTRSELLIDKGAIIDLQDNNNCTALHIAALYGHDLLANTLLMHGADVNLKGFAGRTPLHMSCISGYVECCRKFLQHHVDMDCQDNTGKTPLHCASYSGAVKCLDLLVSSGANFRIPDNINRTPLHYAAAMGRYSCLIALVSVGSDVNKRDKDGCTALHLAAAYDMEGRCLEYLLHHKAEPYLEDYEGYTPIHYAIASKKGNETGLGYLLNSIGGKASVLSNDFKSKFSPLHLAAYYGHGDILRLLLPLFSNVNLTANGARVTALHLASLKGHPQCVQLLLRCGALVNVLDIQLCTPLHCAAAKGHVDCLSLLLNNTEDHSVVNNVDSKKRTALMLSVANKHNECVLRLLQNGADTNIEDENQHTPLFRAVVMGNHEIVRLLLNNKANLYHRNHCGKTVFHMACMLGQLHCLMELIANCFNEEPIRILDNNQFSVHHWAAYNGHAHCLEYLLKCNICKTLEGNIFSPLHCSSNISCVNCLIYYFGNNACHLRDHCNRTPLHIAALYNRTNCIEALISSDADIERRDSNGRTPLLCAAYNGNVQSIEVLLKFKANVFAQDDYGNTVLHICCTRKHSHAACFFLDKCKILQIDLKVLVNITNNQLKIPLHIAAHNGLVSITKQLIKAESDILAVDQNGMTPALNCAASVNVAQCLNLILANYPVINSNIHRNLIVEVERTGDKQINSYNQAIQGTGSSSNFTNNNGISIVNGQTEAAADFTVFNNGKSMSSLKSS